MTECAPTRRAGLSPLPVLTSTLAAFLVVLALLAWQMSRGRDPALGAAGEQASAPQPARRIVLKRRIVRKVVIEHVVPPPVYDDAPATPGGRSPSPSGSSPGPVTASAPRSYSAAPAAPSAPVASAPAPAPSPPVTTKTS